MNTELLKKVAEAIDEGMGATEQKEHIEAEGKKPEKEEKKKVKPDKKGGNPFAKKEEGAPPAESNGQAGPVPAEKVPVEGETPVAGAEAVPAEGGVAPVEGATPAGAVPAEGAAPAAGPVGITQIIDFLQQNPNPNDASVHAFAEQNGMAPDQMETMIYGLSTKMVNFLRGGKMNDKQLDISTVNPQELTAGISVELEHTPDPAIAKKIALDHLAEGIPDYYTRLQAMETQAKSEANAVAIPKKEGVVEDEKPPNEETKENDVNQPVGANNRAEL